MLRGFGNMILHNFAPPELSDWIFQLGLEASSWGTAAIANTWLNEEALFHDLKTIDVPTLILHGLDDKVCHYQLAIAQKGLHPPTRFSSPSSPAVTSCFMTRWINSTRSSSALQRNKPEYI